MKNLFRGTTIAYLSLALMLAVTTGFAQTQLQHVPVNQTQSGDIVIGPGDTIRIRILDTPDLSEDVRVSETGSARLPLIGVVELGGQTEEQAASLLDVAYTNGGYVLHPNASVQIVSYAERGVSITGEVAKPGIYPVSGLRTLVDMVALAGGLTTSADTRITIQYHDGTVKVLEFPLDKPEKDFENSNPVAPGDRIIVPRAGVVYVLGQVGKPGGYLMQHDGRITVLQAVGEAGGSTRLAYEGHVLLLRPSDGYKPIHIYLNKIYKGKQPDIPLASGDVVYVPSSVGKDFLVNLPQIMGTLAGAAIYAVNVSH